MTRLLALALAATLLASTAAAQPADKSPFAPWLTAAVSAQIADNVSTQIAMAPYVDATGREVARTEVNPLLSRDRGANALAQAGATILTVVVLRKMEPHHPKLARGLALGLATLGTVDTLNNVRNIRRDR